MSKKEVIPPLEFSSIIMPFYARGMEAIEKGEFALAMRLIDLLDLLREKTRGNLTDKEEELLINASTELRILYLKKSEGNE